MTWEVGDSSGDWRDAMDERAKWGVFIGTDESDEMRLIIDYLCRIVEDVSSRKSKNEKKRILRQNFVRR